MPAMRTLSRIDYHCCITEAAQLLTLCDQGALLVTRDGQAVGVVSERDLVQLVLALRKDPIHTRVGHLLETAYGTG